MLGFCLEGIQGIQESLAGVHSVSSEWRTEGINLETGAIGVMVHNEWIIGSAEVAALTGHPKVGAGNGAQLHERRCFTCALLLLVGDHRPKARRDNR